MPSRIPGLVHADNYTPPTQIDMLMKQIESISSGAK